MSTKSSNKLALFVPALRGGGAQRVMLILAARFVELNLQVDLVLSNATGPYLDEVPSGVRVINLESSRVLTSMPRLMSYLKNEKPFALLSTMGHANLAAIWARKVSGVQTRLFVRVENTVSVDLNESGFFRSFLYKYIIRLSYLCADGIIAPSQGVADDLIRNIGLPDELIHVIYNPVIRKEILDKAKQEIDHPWLAQDKQLPLILGVGRLTKQKDFATLIQAFALVHKHKAARLLILGEGEDRLILENLVNEIGLEKYVDLHGFVDNPYAYMARASVFVLSSKWEGLPNTLIEAMATGVPVVSTNCESGPYEILDGGKYGELVSKGDVDGMAKAILNIIETGHIPDNMSQWLKKFSKDECIDRYLDVLHVRQNKDII
ncbi:MAG: glycosyltransferase [Gammaproteobacteria bacterium]|nr:glycosyltransferase [Gammaproteobacteria bacterium]